MIYLQLFWSFFKVGLFTFGGGYAMLPMITDEVEAHGWLSSTDLVNFIAISESTPGPFAVNISTYVGSVTGGIIGALCATLGVILPSFIIILCIAKIYEKFQNSRLVTGVMSGLKPAVVGMIGSAVISVGSNVFLPNGYDINVFATNEFYISFGIFFLMAILSFRKCHPILIILFSATIGIAAGYALGF